jgi:hypothetical protein
MRITFPRLPDHSRGYALVERDDGVTYQLWGGPVTPHLPHDLVHFTVEDALAIGDGIWAAIASGVVFKSMGHVAGRRRAHADERSDLLVRAHRPDLSRAETVGGFVEAVAALDRRDAVTVRRLSKRWLSRPMTNLYTVDGELDTDRVLAAADRLRSADVEWRALPVGAELVRTWPVHRRLPRVVASTRRPATSRRGRGGVSLRRMVSSISVPRAPAYDRSVPMTSNPALVSTRSEATLSVAARA